MSDMNEFNIKRPLVPGTEDSGQPLVELTHVEKHFGDLHVLKASISPSTKAKCWSS